MTKKCDDKILLLRFKNNIMIANQLKSVIRDIHDFPKPGIIFKDITPILKDAQLCKEITADIVAHYKNAKIDAVAGIESRGFLFGMMIANALNIPFIPIRKKGKLPAKVVAQSYHLEYGTATIEIHEDAFPEGSNILLHDDLLATGGSAQAACDLIEKIGGKIAGINFLVSLDFLNGMDNLTKFDTDIYSVVHY